MREDKHVKSGKNVKAFIMLSIILLIAFAGCTGKEKTVSTPGGDVKISEGSGLGPDWCKAGTSMTNTGVQGQGYSFVIKGMTTYQGKDVCEADAKFDQGWQSGSMTYYYSQDGKYMHMVMKDASGSIINEMDVNNPQ